MGPKSHITALEALRILHSKFGLRDVELICAGSTYDYRWLRYFEEPRQKVEAFGLSSQEIWFLGKIPQIEQIAIVMRAVAVVQPTLFEGGPGGSSCVRCGGPRHAGHCLGHSRKLRRKPRDRARNGALFPGKIGGSACRGDARRFFTLATCEQSKVRQEREI